MCCFVFCFDIYDSSVCVCVCVFNLIYGLDCRLNILVSRKALFCCHFLPSSYQQGGPKYSIIFLYKKINKYILSQFITIKQEAISLKSKIKQRF